MSPEKICSRSANFNTCEIEFLIQTIARYKDVIECKKTDRSTAEDKAKAWKDVEREFNAQFGNFSFRTAKVLKTKYDNLKKNAKKSIRYSREVNGATFMEDATSLDQMGYMDETQLSTDKLFSDSVRDYFEETLADNENSRSSWHETEDDRDQADEAVDIKEKIYEVSDSDGTLLVPMHNKPLDNSNMKFNSTNGRRQLFADPILTRKNSAAKTGRNVQVRHLEKEMPAYGKNNHNLDVSGVSEHRLWRNEFDQPLISSTKKSSIQLFCDSLALQIEEASLTAYQLISLQVDILKKLQEYLPNGK